MPVLRNIGRLATCSRDGGIGQVQTLENAAITWENGLITWVGHDADLSGDHGMEHDAGGRLVTPGLVDCHTHLAFGGWRADEFSIRSSGATYLEIQQAGGGIRSTMRHTRESSEDELFARAGGFLSEMSRLGVTTIEAKSGYGLSLEDELKLLRVYRRLSGAQPVQVVSTFLGAHVMPPEFTEPAVYIDHLIHTVLPAVAAGELAEFCDVFVEEGAFDDVLARRLFAAASRLGLRPKLHVDQLSDGGGGELAASVGAVSADHLEYTSASGMLAMAAAGVVAVALPIATLYLRQKPMDGRGFLEAGCRVAVATDFNPGSAPSYHLPFAMMLACTMNGLSPAEALRGVTINAAAAIGREAVCGSVEPGKRADFAIVDADSVEQWVYHFVPNAVRETFIAGKPVLG
ncbi:MAG: imidazolonepropionase [Rhodothermales bacterium]|jgi:imidazolonepropionase